MKDSTKELYTRKFWIEHVSRLHLKESWVGTGLLCLSFYLLCYGAVLIKFTYYVQARAHNIISTYELLVQDYAQE